MSDHVMITAVTKSIKSAMFSMSRKNVCNTAVCINMPTHLCCNILFNRTRYRHLFTN